MNDGDPEHQDVESRALRLRPCPRTSGTWRLPGPAVSCLPGGGPLGNPRAPRGRHRWLRVPDVAAQTALTSLRMVAAPNSTLPPLEPLLHHPSLKKVRRAF